MTKKGSAPHKKKNDNGKKQHKRLQRIEAHLQKAREAFNRAEERLQRAEERSRKKQERVQLLEGHLAALRLQGDAQVQLLFEAPPPDGPENHTLETTLEDTPSQQSKAQETGHDLSIMSTEVPGMDNPLVQAVGHADEEAITADEVISRARQARAVAQAAEQAAREATERAQTTATRLEQFGGGRHLTQELERLEAEADKTRAIAQTTDASAQDAERLLTDMGLEAPVDPGNEQREEILDLDDEQEESSLKTASVDVEAIASEEALVETVAAAMIANAAAAAAAEAEAIAEVSSARTREARLLALAADRLVAQLRTAIHDGSLIGQNAEDAIQAAEREATHAHATLADAEAAEEQALSAAVNAEAEAEVAEGMALATSQHQESAESVETIRKEVANATRQQKTHDDKSGVSELTGAGSAARNKKLIEEDNAEKANQDEEETLKMPGVHSQKSHE